jgi:tetratricopeptide (TPR) repeat protein
MEVSVIDGQMDEIDALKREGQYTEAKELLGKVCEAPELTPDQVERINCFDAEFLVIDNRLQDAEAVYDGILAANPRCARAMCGKGALAGERQEWSVAQGWFEKALSCRANYDVALAGLGLCEMVGKREEKAFNLFMRAIASNPENRRALLGVLQLGYPMKKYSEIERSLNSFLELHPANIEMLYSFAGILFAQGKVEQAKLEVEKILVFEPKNPLALELRDIIRGEKPLGTPVM